MTALSTAHGDENKITQALQTPDQDKQPNYLTLSFTVFCLLLGEHLLGSPHLLYWSFTCHCKWHLEILTNGSPAYLVDVLKALHCLQYLKPTRIRLTKSPPSQPFVRSTGWREQHFFPQDSSLQSAVLRVTNIHTTWELTKNPEQPQQSLARNSRAGESCMISADCDLRQHFRAIAFHNPPQHKAWS